MKTIELFEKAIAEKAGNLEDYGINGTMFWAYRKSPTAGNDLIDFNEVIWDKDIESIVTCMKEKGITEFTISSTFSGLIPTLAAFDKFGFKVAEVTEVNAPYKDWQSDTYARIPALRIMHI